MGKRGRTDGHLSKEEYESSVDDDSRAYYAQPSSTMSEFSRATPSTLATRRMITGQRLDRKQQFANHILALNTSFHDWLKSQIASNPNDNLSEGFQDYIDHVTALELRYLRSYGEVLTFGSGDCGQLAHGVDEEDDLMVRFPRVVFSLRDKRVYGVACGGLHTAVFTEGGQVYTWGCADDGSLGRPGDENVPILIDGLGDQTIIGIACGDGQTVAVSTNGTVWAWGSYKDKEGKKWFNPPNGVANSIKDIKKQQDLPVMITGLSDIVEVACGSAFNLAKDSCGTVYSWGIGESGELGRKAPPLKSAQTPNEDGEPDYDYKTIMKYHLTPAVMMFMCQDDGGAAGCSNPSWYGTLDDASNGDLQGMKEAKSFGCGSYHSMVVAVGGSVYVCGLNNYGQLGLGDDDTENRIYLTPADNLSDHGVVSLKGGVHHSLALTSSGRVIAFGRGDSGQLGSSETSKGSAGDFKGTPVYPSIPDNVHVVQIACGGNHNLALTAKNEVYTWGYGDMLALGHGDEKDEPLPKKLNFSKAKIDHIQITQIDGGGQHSALIGNVSIVTPKF